MIAYKHTSFGYGSAKSMNIKAINEKMNSSIIQMKITANNNPHQVKDLFSVSYLCSIDLVTFNILQLVRQSIDSSPQTTLNHGRMRGHSPQYCIFLMVKG